MFDILIYCKPSSQISSRSTFTQQQWRRDYEFHMINIKCYDFDLMLLQVEAECMRFVRFPLRLSSVH